MSIDGIKAGGMGGLPQAKDPGLVEQTSRLHRLLDAAHTKLGDLEDRLGSVSIRLEAVDKTSPQPGGPPRAVMSPAAENLAIAADALSELINRIERMTIQLDV